MEAAAGPSPLRARSLSPFDGGMTKTTRSSAYSDLVAWGLTHRVPGLGASFALLRVTGRRTGRIFEFPVQYARDGEVVIVLPARPEQKNWWRNLQTRSGLEIWLEGGWRSGDAVVVREGSREYDGARAVYIERWASAARTRAPMFVRIDLDPRMGVTFGPTPRPKHGEE